MKKTNLTVFASGSGSNAEAIISYFKDHSLISVKAIFTNNPKAYVIERGKKLNVPVYVFDKEGIRSESFVDMLKQYDTDYIILAGYLWMVPKHLTDTYEDRIINIHPALLPKFGGKGMYGHHVHRAVIDAGEKISGITIHLVNERYDEGRTIFQAWCDVLPGDTPDTLAERIHALEHRHFPKAIEDYIQQRTSEDAITQTQ